MSRLKVVAKPVIKYYWPVREIFDYCWKVSGEDLFRLDTEYPNASFRQAAPIDQDLNLIEKFLVPDTFIILKGYHL